MDPERWQEVVDRFDAAGVNYVIHIAVSVYSTFAYETTKLAQADARGAAAWNFLLTTGGCFLAVVLGLAAARAFAK